MTYLRCLNISTLSSVSTQNRSFISVKYTQIKADRHGIFKVVIFGVCFTEFFALHAS